MELFLFRRRSRQIRGISAEKLIQDQLAYRQGPLDTRPPVDLLQLGDHVVDELPLGHPTSRPSGERCDRPAPRRATQPLRQSHGSPNPRPRSSLFDPRVSSSLPSHASDSDRSQRHHRSNSSIRRTLILLFQTHEGAACFCLPMQLFFDHSSKRLPQFHSLRRSVCWLANCFDPTCSRPSRVATVAARVRPRRTIANDTACVPHRLGARVRIRNSEIAHNRLPMFFDKAQRRRSMSGSRQ